MEMETEGVRIELRKETQEQKNPYTNCEPSNFCSILPDFVFSKFCETFIQT